MSRSRSLIPKVLALSAVTSLSLVGCGGGIEGGGGDDGAESVAVGSKQFTEQVILGQMMVLALEDAGFAVEDETGLQGTSVVRSALEGDDVDLYWEYTGTAWAEILSMDDVIADPQELYTKVKKADEENGIVWGEPGKFENTYAIAQSAAVAQEFGVTTLTELGELSASDPDAATVCLAEEFSGRQDGWVGMSELYGIEVPEDNVALMGEGLIYDQTADGPNSDCNFGMVFTTDGRIGALNLQVLEDDQGFFPKYNPALTVREEVAEENPEILEIGNDIMSRLDTTTMQELNLRVDGEEGIPADQVAREWLEEEGLIG